MPRRFLAAALIVLAFAGAALWHGRAGEASRLMAALLAPAAAGGGTMRQPIVLAGGRGGDSYRGAWPHASLVLVPGASRAGKDEPRFVAFAAALAAAGFAVVVPDIAGLRELQISAADAEAIAAAVQTAAAAAPRGGSVVVAAVSYGVGPAILAALQPQIRDRVRLIVGVGGYHDLTATIAFFTTGWHRDAAGAWRHRSPNSYGKWAFLHSNAERLTDSGDRALLAAMAERRAVDATAPLDDLAARLGPQGRPVYELVTNADPERVPALLAALPPLVGDEIAALDLARRDLRGLKARLLLVHGRDDGIVPAEQSLSLAAAVPQGQAEVILVDGLDHVSPQPTNWSGAVALWRALYRLLEERDAAGSG